jgi:hypothetical protein
LDKDLTLVNLPKLQSAISHPKNLPFSFSALGTVARNLDNRHSCQQTSFRAGAIWSDYPQHRVACRVSTGTEVGNLKAYPFYNE